MQTFIEVCTFISKKENYGVIQTKACTVIGKKDNNFGNKNNKIDFFEAKDQEKLKIIKIKLTGLKDRWNG